MNQDDRTISRSALIAELERLADPERPVPLLALAVGREADREEVDEMARVTGDGYQVTDPAEIQAVILQAVMTAGQNGRAPPRNSRRSAGNGIEQHARAHPAQRRAAPVYGLSGKPTGQLCTGSPLCISSAYRRVVAPSAASRASPASSPRWYVSACQDAPFTRRLQRSSMTPR